MRRLTTLLALVLVILPAITISYRILWLGYPVFPVAPGTAWQISMDGHVDAGKNGIRVEIGLPENHPQQLILNESFTSGALDFILKYTPPNRIGVWSETGEVRPEFIAYRGTLLTRPHDPEKQEPPDLEDYPAKVELVEQNLAQRLVAQWSAQAPAVRLRSITATLDNDWGASPPSEDDFRAWSNLYQRHGRITSLLVLLRAANLPARSVEGLRLAEGMRTAPLTWIETWTGKQWESFSPDTGLIEPGPASLLPLAIGGAPIVRVSAGKVSDIRWNLRRSIINRWDAHFERIRQSGQWLDQWALFHLPPEFQETFRIVLLIPIGALLVSVLRNVVGFTTFGTFMPVLMALAFRTTGLAYGLGIFFFIIGIGYFMRLAVDGLRLLLVPRLSLLLTAVIACLTAFALIGNKIGVQEFMAVGLLPIVILTMIIERFFLIVEEAGARQGFQIAAGSGVVAVIIYGLIQWDALQITFFVFPELILVVAAGQVLLGRYTGFRISELIRFKEFRSPS